jgi:LacI family transcriptional regulator
MRRDSSSLGRDNVVDNAVVTMRPTMTDVAQAAQVSLKTVSRVVNGEPGVRPDTAARVEVAIRALGFRRNDIARALRQGQVSRTVGLVIEDLANPFYSGIARGVETETRERGLLVITGSSDEDPERERMLVQLLCERRVDGLLVVPAGDDHRYLLPELRIGTPIVFIDRPPGQIDADVILLDNVGGARAAVAHLVAHGHRRIAHVGDSTTIFTAAQRLEGYREALREAGLPLDESLVRLGPHDTASAEAAVRELLTLLQPPTALFTGNNRITTGALRAVASAERPPALVGFDDLELGALMPVPVSVVSYDPVELGRRSARLLCERLEGVNGEPQRLVLPTTLIPRGSGEVRP